MESGRATEAVWAPFVMGGSNYWQFQHARWADLPDLQTATFDLSKLLCPVDVGVGMAPVEQQGRYFVLCRDGQFAVEKVGKLPTQWKNSGIKRDDLQGYLALKLTPNLRYAVVTGPNGLVVVIDTETGIPTRLKGNDNASILAISGDSRLVAIAGDLGTVDIRGLPDLGLWARIPARLVRDLRFLPGGDLLIAGEKTLKRWTPPEAQVVGMLSAQEGVTGVMFDPSGTRLASSHGTQDALLWSLPAGTRIGGLKIGPVTAKNASFTPSGQELWFGLVAPPNVIFTTESIDLEGKLHRSISDSLVLQSALHFFPGLPANPPPAGLGSRRLGP